MVVPPVRTLLSKEEKRNKILRGFLLFYKAVTPSFSLPSCLIRCHKQVCKYDVVDTYETAEVINICVFHSEVMS